MQASTLAVQKARAGGLHFVISAGIVLAVLLAVTLLWYPSGFRLASGLIHLAVIMGVVDLVLGPALTMLVYRPGKPSLRFDLAVIAAVQIAALVYGAASMYAARPIYVALVVDRFEAVSAADLDEAALAQAHAPFDRVPSRGLVWVRVELPTDQEELAELTLAEAIQGTGPALLPRLYRPFERVPTSVLARARPLDELERYNDPARVRAALAGIAQAPGAIRFMPLHAISRDMSVLVGADDGEVIGVVDLRPWS